MKVRKDSKAITMAELGVANGNLNLGFVEDPLGNRRVSTIERAISTEEKGSDLTGKEGVAARPQWGSGIEFLMSCIAMSVGLGNIWRFPFTAYENGGGAFLIPYFIVLAIIGRPLYFMEMSIGQFTSKGAVKIWALAPLLAGVGCGQVILTFAVMTYYLAIMAITLFYLISSFQSELPWSYCRPSWENCFDSVRNVTAQNQTTSNTTVALRSSSELYFLHDVLHEIDQIDDGIGMPNLELTLCLIVSWVIVFLIMIKGVQSSGKASYFLALFPYVVLLALLVRGVTLPGAGDGILFFITPKWEALLSPKVWYAAVTQAFYSLGVCFGSIITYSSYNNFRHNIYRDAMIVTVMDTLTSLIAGCTIFGILGNLAYTSGAEDISKVTQGGTGLAFISYPDAITKFEFVPQFFSVIFFVMLYILGIGTAVSMTGAVVTFFSDQFPKWKYWAIGLVTCSMGCLLGLPYMTPGGQYILNLIDYFAGSFTVLFLASIEAVGILWIYGLENFCNDLEFMLEMKIGFYWRLCWGVITPILLIVISIYSLVIAEPLSYKGYQYPDVASAFGWTLMIVGIIQVPLWAAYIFQKNRQPSAWETLKEGFRPNDNWGPSDPSLKKEWEQYKRKRKEEVSDAAESPLRRAFRVLFNLSR